MAMKVGSAAPVNVLLNSVTWITRLGDEAVKVRIDFTVRRHWLSKRYKGTCEATLPEEQAFFLMGSQLLPITLVLGYNLKSVWAQDDLAKSGRAEGELTAITVDCGNQVEPFARR